MMTCKRESMVEAFGRGSFCIEPDDMFYGMHLAHARQCPLCGAPPEHFGCGCEISFHDAIVRPGGLHDFLSRQTDGEFTGTLCETVGISSSPNGPAHCERANYCRPVQIDARFLSEAVSPLSGLLVRIIQKRLLANIPAPTRVSDSLFPGDVDEKGGRAQVPECENGSLELHGVNEGSATIPNNPAQRPSEPVNGAMFVLSKVASRSEALAALSEEMRRKEHARKLRNRVSALKSNKKRAEKFNQLAANVESQRKMIASLKEREELLLAENYRLSEMVSRSCQESREES
jgi:hypothetical protein